MAVPSVKFFNGQSMPLVGLGTWQSSDPTQLEVALDEALKLGYRHIDTAYLYENEDVIGRVLKKHLDSGNIKREDLFIVTKLPMIGNTPEKVPYFLEKSLKALQLDYVDLYLIHGPIGFQYVDDKTLFPRDEANQFLWDFSTNLEAVWKAMEVQVEAGRAKSIGVSNFNRSQVERIVKVSKIQPANLQIELNAYTQRQALVETCRKHNITVVAYAPIGSPGRKELYAKRGLEFTPIPIMEDPAVVSIAQKYGKTPAQVLMRFLVQLDIVVIPKSTNVDRLRQNFDLFSFELTADEIQSLRALDKGEAGKSFGRPSAYSGLEKHPEYSTED